MAARAWGRRREIPRLDAAIRKAARHPDRWFPIVLQDQRFVVMGLDLWARLNTWPFDQTVD